MRLQTRHWIMLGAGAALLFVAYRAKQAVQETAQAVNPVNPENVFYSSVNAVGEALSGDKIWTFGGWLYDLTHKDYNPNE